MSTIKVERDGPITTLRIDKERGNAIDQALVDDLARATEQVSDDGDTRVVLLASAHPKLFCPGLDLVSLFDYDRRQLESFMGKFAAVVWALYGLSKPVIAALSGHAVAGGCVLALTADYRVLRRGVQVGLNEVRVGVPLPWSVALLLRATVGPGALSRVALLGRNFKDEEAVAAGLADEVAEANTFESVCRERLAEFADKDPRALGITKSYLRAPVLAEMRHRERDVVSDFVECWFSEATRERIRATIESLNQPR